MSKVRYREIDTYGSGGTTVRYIEASAQFGMYGFAGKGHTADEARAALCREIEGNIADLRHAIAEIEAETPSAVEPAD